MTMNRSHPEWRENLPKRFLFRSLASRLRIVEERLQEIEEEIEERERIGNALRSAVEGGTFYERRAKVLKKMERIDGEINQEMEQQWRDIQWLTRERRELKEKREELLARKRSVGELLEDVERGNRERQ